MILDIFRMYKLTFFSLSTYLKKIQLQKIIISAYNKEQSFEK